MSAPRIHLDGRIFGQQRHGGISRVFRELLREWRLSGALSAHLYLPPSCDPSVFRDLAERVIPFCPPPVLRPRGFLHAVNARRSAAAIDRFWAQASDGVYLSSFYSTHASLRIPQLFVLQDMIYERYPALFPADKGAAHVAEKQDCAAAAAAFVTPSAHALGEARHYYPVGARPARVIPYAVTAEFLRDPRPGMDKMLRDRFTGGREYLLFAGGRGGHKNFAGLLAAFRDWPGREPIHLLAVGGGAPGPHDAALLESFGLGPHVHFVPSVGESELVDLFQAARAVVVPSLCEGYGFPVIEGLAARRPVVASTGGSLPEVGGDAAIYADPRDPSSLADGLSEAVETRDDSPRIRRGREIAESRTWNDVASDYAALLKEMRSP